MAIILNAVSVSMLKEFSVSQAVKYAVELVIYRKRCEIQMLLLQTTNEVIYGVSYTSISDDF